MIQFFKDLYNGFINANIFKKTVIALLLVFYILIITVLTVKVDYEVVTPGHINNTVKTTADDKTYAVLDIDTDNISGKIYTVGVYSHIRVSYFQYLLSKYSKDIDIDEYDPKTSLTKKEEYVRGVIHKDYSIINALIVAYEAAKEKNDTVSIDYEFKGIVVSAVMNYSKSYLQPNDIITKVNGVQVTSLVQFKQLRDAVVDEGFFKLTVLRDEEEKEINSQKVLRNDASGNPAYFLGIEASEYYVINSTFPKYKISENIRSIGSSGGAMMALAIYNSLLEEDVTNSKIIVGTGTIDIHGVIGDIGGVRQKIATAELYGADIFFVNPEDYAEAKKKYDEIQPSFKLVKVNNFNDILNELAGGN